MLKIKLARFGRKHQPNYRIVVAEKRSKRDGAYVAQVGNYNPITKKLELEVEQYNKWLAQGAQPTETVASLFKKATTK